MPTLFLSGDLMLGRGIDQILPQPCPPELFEPWVRDARDYVRLMTDQKGPLPTPVAPDYPWGFALEVLDRLGPQLRLVNLETAVTCSANPWPGKGIHYRLSPQNAAVLGAAALDGCILANNHVLDWGRPGLTETLLVLKGLGIQAIGAGRDDRAARAPAIFPLPSGRLLAFGCGHGSSGIPRDWSATGDRAGVWYLDKLGQGELDEIAAAIQAWRRPGDRVLVSIHWGGNWGFAVPAEQKAFARALVELGVDLVHGHSSHHVKGLEIYKGRLILYGAGDLINDYEGIAARAGYRDDLSFLYLPTLADDGALASLLLVPTRLEQFRLVPPAPDEVAELGAILARESRLAFTTTQEGWLRLA
ncbi:CapA family protein [Gallaecimonas sp. GXIMD4217]|uniref:CapA family protein n=1 Tax=Gallaecimonas sp. GXIMD4217 TaxID=3131927 RepID=UPI00311AFE51